MSPESHQPALEAFCDAVARAAGEPVSPGLREALAEIQTEAAARWPGVALDSTELGALLGARLSGAPLAVRALRAADLLLALAAAGGDPRAIKSVEALVASQVEHFGRAGALHAADRDDLRQRVREFLLLGAGGEPGLLGYGGRGELAAWLRVVVVREGLRLRRSARREEPTEDAVIADVLPPTGDPELAYLKKLYHEAFASALREALAKLEPKSRLVLAQHFVDGLSIDRIGALHQTHRATAARWIAHARAELFSQTRWILMTRLGLDRAEVESLLRLVKSQLSISLRALGPGKIDRDIPRPPSTPD
jgi:RNA polymerase sigma-70 factor (ECF subfamily)